MGPFPCIENHKSPEIVDLFCVFISFKRLLKLSSGSTLRDNLSFYAELWRNGRKLRKQPVEKFISAEARSRYLQSSLTALFVIQAWVRIHLSVIFLFIWGREVVWVWVFLFFFFSHLRRDADFELLGKRR